MWKSVLSFLGSKDNDDVAYDPDKFRLYGDSIDRGSGAVPDPTPSPAPDEPPLPPPEPLPPPIDPDDGSQTGGLGAPNPVQMGCWLLPQEYVNYSGGARQTVTDRSAFAAKTQIAAVEASAGAGSTLALYDDKTFRTPFEVTQEVVCTGQMVNTYTGEVSDVYEQNLPPPNRQGGDPAREWKNASLRLQAAQGYETKSRRRKTELEQPLPAGDSGPILANASFRQMQAVAQESNERCTRDKYFTRNDLVPTEPQMTTNPFGYRGFQNMMRVNPYLPVTQELDNKAWLANAQELPTTARFLETETRLHQDALAGRVGLSEGGAGFEDQMIPPAVRVSQTQRSSSTTKQHCGRGLLYGAAAAPRVASAQSVMDTLRGHGEDVGIHGGGGNHHQEASSAMTGRHDRRLDPRMESSTDARSFAYDQEQRTGGRTTAQNRKSPQASGGPIQGRPDAVGLVADNSERSRESSKKNPKRNLYGSSGGVVSGFDSSLFASKGFVASAEECRKTVLGSRRNENAETSMFAHRADSALEASRRCPQELPMKSRNDLSGNYDAAAAIATGAQQFSDEYSTNGAIMLPSSAYDRGIAQVGQKFFSDKRGIVVSERAPGSFEKVGGDTISLRRPDAPERPPQNPELYISREGQPDAIESQRAFRGENVRKVRQRNPTPRRGGAEKIRGGLARLTDPPTTMSG